MYLLLIHFGNEFLKNKLNYQMKNWYSKNSLKKKLNACFYDLYFKYNMQALMHFAFMFI